MFDVFNIRMRKQSPHPYYDFINEQVNQTKMKDLNSNDKNFGMEDNDKKKKELPRLLLLIGAAFTGALLGGILLDSTDNDE